MKYKILIKLTSLAISFALCLSALPSRGFFADAKMYVDEGDYYYDIESVKDMFYNISYNKNPDEVLSNCDKKHKERNNFISKIVFSIGAAVIAAKLAWDLYKMHKENKNTLEKENKNKKHTDEKGFWTKIKEKLSVFKGKFLGYTALITLCIDFLIRHRNNYLYFSERKKIPNLLNEEKDFYFKRLRWLAFLSFNPENLIDAIWRVSYDKYYFGISFLSQLYPKKDLERKNISYTEEEKVKFAKDFEEIRTEINKIFKENGMNKFTGEVADAYGNGTIFLENNSRWCWKSCSSGKGCCSTCSPSNGCIPNKKVSYWE